MAALAILYNEGKKMIRKLVSIMSFLLLVGVVAFLIVGIVGYLWHPGEPPSIQDAPWMVQTSSRTYYAKEVTSLNGNPAIRHFWISDGGSWRENKKDIKVFDKRLYGNVAIIRRVK